MKRNKLSIIVPVYNEDENVLNFVLKGLREILDSEIIVVDDGSTYPVWNATVMRRRNKGYGNAIKAGIRKAKGDYIAIIDADAQYDVQDLQRMWRELDTEDMLIGKRICHQGNFKRAIARISAKIVASIACMRYIPDLNSGLRIFRKGLAKSYSSILCDEFSFSTSLTMCFVLDGLKVKWTPIGFYPRQGNNSTVKMLRHGLIMLYQIIYLTVGLRTRKLRAWLRSK
jgi:glycosyltransferase involved in cell wall biosynthesis